MIVFDIETGSLPWGQLKDRIPPFDELAAVPDPKPFDVGGVALGNLKDQAKIQQKIADARAKWELDCETIEKRRADARNQHVAKYLEKAALSACTGMVKAIGLCWMSDDPSTLLLIDEEVFSGFRQDKCSGCDARYYGNERDLIAAFWSAWDRWPAEYFVGHCIYKFDLPFLVQRSWMLGVDVPSGVQQANGRWSNQFVDTMDRWGCGTRDYFKLDDLARALGMDGKPADCTGADFARLFDEGGESRERALAYLRNDLEMTRRVAEAMQIL